MEKALKLASDDGKVIHGTLDYCGRMPEQLIVFVHGLAGYQNEHMFFNGTRFFVNEGYATLRFNFYDDPFDARRLDECTLATHVADLNSVIEYARGRKFQDIFLIGHSLGGPIILASDTADLKGVVMWDPVFDLHSLVARNTLYIEALDNYVINWGVKHIWSPRIIAELNGQYVKLAKVEGDFVSHTHKDEDELFFVVKGELSIEFSNHSLTLGEGELCVIPKGIEHKPSAERETWIMLFEPKATAHTGETKSELTVSEQEWI